MGKRLRHVGYHVHGLRFAETSRDYAGPRQLVIPVLRESPGQEYLLVPGRGRLFGVPYAVATADRLDACDGSDPDGFLPLDKARKHGIESGMEYMLRHLRAAAVRQRPGGRGDRPEGGGAGRRDAGAAGGAADSGPAAGQRPRRPSALSPQQRSLLSGVLGDLAAGNGLQVFDLAAGLASQFAGAELREALGDLLQLGDVDDQSSSAEWLQETALGMAADAVTGQVLGAIGGLLADRVDGPSLLDQAKTMLLGETSTAFLGACARGHLDDQGNHTIGDAGLQVLVEGVPIAAAADPMAFVAPKMAMFADGSTTVLTGGKFVSRCGSATAVPSTMVVGAPSVLVGGPGLCKTAILIAQTSMQAGVPPAQVLSQVKAAQRAFDAEKRAGSSDEVAEAYAAAAAGQREVSPETKRTLANVLYSESKDRRGADDPRGAVPMTMPDGSRAFLVDPDGTEGVPVDFQPGDLLRIAATGEEFRVVKVTMEGGLLGELTAYELVDAHDPARAVLTISGTDETGDWATNFLQGLGLVPPQYRRAAELAEEFRQRHPGGSILGHSLGGGLAAYAGLMTGLPTDIYNPAGLGDGTLDRVYARGVNVSMASIRTHIVDGEALDTLQWLGVSPPSAGEVERYEGNPRPFRLPIPGVDEVFQWFQHGISEHKMPAVRDAMQNREPIEIEIVDFRTPG